MAMAYRPGNGKLASQRTIDLAMAQRQANNETPAWQWKTALPMEHQPGNRTPQMPMQRPRCQRNSGRWTGNGNRSRNATLA